METIKVGDRFRASTSGNVWEVVAPDRNDADAWEAVLVERGSGNGEVNNRSVGERDAFFFTGVRWTRIPAPEPAKVVPRAGQVWGYTDGFGGCSRMTLTAYDALGFDPTRPGWSLIRDVEEPAPAVNPVIQAIDEEEEAYIARKMEEHNQLYAESERQRIEKERIQAQWEQQGATMLWGRSPFVSGYSRRGGR